MAITQTQLDSFASQVATIIRELLADDLGLYQVEQGQIPAVWISPPDLPQTHKILDNSGIEAVLNLEPKLGDGGLIGQRSYHLRFELILRQWAYEIPLAIAVSKIQGDRRFIIHQEPVIRPYTELDGAIFPAQARINLVATHISSYS